MFYNIFPQKSNFYFKILRTFKIFNNEIYIDTISVKNLKTLCFFVKLFCGKIIYAEGLLFQFQNQVFHSLQSKRQAYYLHLQTKPLFFLELMFF